MEPIIASTDTTPRRNLPLRGARFTPDAEHRIGRYHMRFARTRGDLEDACRLRFAVFNLELSEGLDESYATGLDVDEFDEQCQHLVVEDTKTGEVVGTYRLQVYESARSSAGLYSAGEFDFSTVEPCVLEASIELGRACVARGHRSRGVLFLLWRGLCEYLLFNGKRGFFGCSSLTSQDENEGVRFYRQLARAGHVHPGLRVAPRADFVCVEDLARQTGARVKPPMLFDIYLKYGAQVLGPPAIDRRFGTIDFLTYHAPTPKQLKTFAGRSE